MSPVYLKWSEWRDEVTEVMLEWGRWEDCWKDFDSCPELEGSREWHGEGNGNPLQCSCLENPRDGGAWWDAVYGVTQSRIRLKQLSSSSREWHGLILVIWCCLFSRKNSVTSSSLSSYVLGLSPFPSLLNPCWKHSTISGPLQVWVSE